MTQAATQRCPVGQFPSIIGVTHFTQVTVAMSCAHHKEMKMVCCKAVPQRSSVTVVSSIRVTVAMSCAHHKEMKMVCLFSRESLAEVTVTSGSRPQLHISYVFRIQSYVIMH